MLPVANLQEVEAAAKREGRPMPDYQVRSRAADWREGA